MIKNELAGGVMPSKYFGAHAAWLRLAVLTFNLLTALKRLALPPELLAARPKQLRFLIFTAPGKLSITPAVPCCVWRDPGIVSVTGATQSDRCLCPQLPDHQPA